jgi:hypothetical protein
LHTGFPEPFPSWQQFCDAFTSVEAPQMLPGGLQAVPLLQVWSAVHATLSPDRWQHASVESQ